MGMLIGDKESYNDEYFMETKKQEAIRLAYEKLGFEWEQIKNIVTENGVLMLSTPDLKYSLKGYDNLIKDKDKFSAFGNDGLKLQPSSLSGIWNNNEWISIESEEDLPKEKIYVYLIDKIKGFDEKPYPFNPNIDACKKELLRHSSYYQPIQKPKNPIF